MSQPVKLFTAKITDEYGGVYPGAIVAIRKYSETSQSTALSEDCSGIYKVEQELEAIAYQVNYWYSEKTKNEGKRSRPLLTEEAGEFTSILTVDLDNPGIANILNAPLDPVDKILRVIKLDFTTKNV